MSLFEPDPLASLKDDSQRPLAERMRPETLEEFVGQQHILGPGKPLRMQIERDQLGSIILWGPPGVGKTTLARIIARLTHCDYIPFSAVLSGIKEIKAVMADAERNRRVGRRTLIFIDEIHRFNKAQQDAFLPYVERGDISLIGATTENPSFEVISALLSRTKVYMLKPLSEDEIFGLLRACTAGGKGRRARRFITANRNLCQRRRPHGPEYPGTGGGSGKRRPTHFASHRRHAAAQNLALRQVRRRAFQPDFGAPQIRPFQRCGCGALLAGADAGSRRRSHVYRPAVGPYGH